MLCQSIRLVGAVGIENTAGRNFKDSEEMMGNAKALKRHNREKPRNSYWPLNGPSFFDLLRFLVCFLAAQKMACRLRVKFRGADGKPTTVPPRKASANMDGWRLQPSVSGKLTLLLPTIVHKCLLHERAPFCWQPRRASGHD